MHEISQVMPYLVAPPPYPFYEWFVLARTIFIAVFLFFLFCIISLLFRTSWLRIRFLESAFELVAYKPFGVRKFVKQWTQIKRRLEVGQDSENKLAIIEADSTFNDVLEKMGFVEETFEGRIKHLTSDLLPNIEQVLEAHKVRNNIVYDPNYQLTLDEAKKIISIYEKALIDLQAL